MDVDLLSRSFAFTCQDKPFLPGLYADPNTDCKVFHSCGLKGELLSFVCGENTRFNQETLTCDYPREDICANSQQYWSSNRGIGKETGEETPKAPETGFTCEDKPHLPGLYADEATNCKVYHVCTANQKDSFFCPEGTLFRQSLLTCDHIDLAQSECASSKQYWNVNSGIGVSTHEHQPNEVSTSTASSLSSSLPTNNEIPVARAVPVSAPLSLVHIRFSGSPAQMSRRLVRSRRQAESTETAAASSPAPTRPRTRARSNRPRNSYPANPPYVSPTVKPSLSATGRRMRVGVPAVRNQRASTTALVTTISTTTSTTTPAPTTAVSEQTSPVVSEQPASASSVSTAPDTAVNSSTNHAVENASSTSQAEPARPVEDEKQAASTSSESPSSESPSSEAPTTTTTAAPTTASITTTTTTTTPAPTSVSTTSTPVVRRRLRTRKPKSTTTTTTTTTTTEAPETAPEEEEEESTTVVSTTTSTTTAAPTTVSARTARRRGSNRRKFGANQAGRPTAAPIPATNFLCPEYQGLFADVETDCRVYHQCFGVGKVSRWCGDGTLFNQEKLACDYPQEVDCSRSVSFYARQRPTPKPSTEKPKTTVPVEEEEETEQPEIEDAEAESAATSNGNDVGSDSGREPTEEDQE